MGLLDKCRKLCSCLRCEPPARQKVVPDADADGDKAPDAAYRELQRQAESIVAEAIKRASDILAREMDGSERTKAATATAATATTTTKPTPTTTHL